ncbi:MAG: MIP family channel protein [Muribaculaceae bacterium]|nr:MIP family channel protein [Muribaculaceae bacterium]MBR3101001.1 MIP family channel protein [Muribaculaceae bacterium]
MKKYLAELVGTFVLTFLGCGAAVSLSCGTDTASVVGTAIAFGLAVVAMAYTIGGISGCHINPAITLGVFLSGKMSAKDCGLYMVFQVIGALLAAAVLCALAGCDSGLGANQLQEGISLSQGIIAEVVLTALFVLVVLGATSKTNGATGNFAGLAIGLSLILIHLVGIHYTGTSVNPARSIGPALLAGGQALTDLWIFIVAPLVGGALAALIWKCISCDKCEKEEA